MFKKIIRTWNKIQATTYIMLVWGKGSLSIISTTETMKDRLDYFITLNLLIKKRSHKQNSKQKWKQK